MDKLGPLWCFLVFVYIFTQTTKINGSTNTKGNDSVMGVIGAIVDNSSRIGKEERLAMKMALEDFYYKFNQSLVLEVRNSQGQPIQAALEGNKIYHTFFFLLNYLDLMLRYETTLSNLISLFNNISVSKQPDHDNNEFSMDRVSLQFFKFSMW